MADNQIRLEFQAIQVHGYWPVQFAGQHAVEFLQTLKFARRHVAAFQDGAR
jgi:hypothetical protein